MPSKPALSGHKQPTGTHSLGRTVLKATAIGILSLQLSGCVHDAAAYIFDSDKKHAITVIRSQNWFWKDTVKVAIVTDKLPDCQDGITVEDVPRTARMALYRPESGVYAEPIYILQIENKYYAVSTFNCRAQAFEGMPDEKGTLVGKFQEDGGRFRFAAAGGTPDGFTLR